jgi:hypothetical protein
MVETRRSQWRVAATRMGAIWGFVMFVVVGPLAAMEGRGSDLPRIAISCAVCGAAYGLWMAGVLALQQRLRLRKLRRHVRDQTGPSNAD